MILIIQFFPHFAPSFVVNSISTFFSGLLWEAVVQLSVIVCVASFCSLPEPTWKFILIIDLKADTLFDREELSYLRRFLILIDAAASHIQMEKRRKNAQSWLILKCAAPCAFHAEYNLKKRNERKMCANDWQQYRNEMGFEPKKNYISDAVMVLWTL